MRTERFKIQWIRAAIGLALISGVIVACSHLFPDLGHQISNTVLSLVSASAKP